MNSTTEASINSTAIQNTFTPLTNVDVCIYSINFLLGFPTHCYILWLIMTGTGSGVASEFFNINISVCELCFSFNCLLIILTNVLHIVSMLPIFLNGITITGRSLFQCLICVERYLAVVHPVTFLKLKPLRYRVICCIPAWIITLISCLCCILSRTAFSFHAFTWYYLSQFLFFISIQLFCLVAVLRALKQSGPGDRSRMKRRAFYLILIFSVSMVIIFVPFIFVGFFTVLTQVVSDRQGGFVLLCFILGGFVNPVLFLHRTRKLSFICSS